MVVVKTTTLAVAFDVVVASVVVDVVVDSVVVLKKVFFIDSLVSSRKQVTAKNPWHSVFFVSFGEKYVRLTKNSFFLFLFKENNH